MATKKKPSKPTHKAAPAAKKKSAPKKPAKPAAKKAGKPAQKPAAKKPLAKHAVKKAIPKHPVKPVAKKPEMKKPEPKKPEIKKPQVHEASKSEAQKPGSTKTIKLVSVPPPPVKKKVEPSKPVKVVIPEIKTKTSKKYEPEFTKSVLDQPQFQHTGPTMRYSDADLTEFRELIQKKLDQAKKELAYLQGLITRKDEMGGDETENRYMTMEDGSMSMEREQLAQMASRQINYIDHLEKALMRIENKTYGICRVTGKLIDKARLRAVPHATLSIEAKQMMSK